MEIQTTWVSTETEVYSDLVVARVALAATRIHANLQDPVAAYPLVGTWRMPLNVNDPEVSISVHYTHIQL